MSIISKLKADDFGVLDSRKYAAKLLRFMDEEKLQPECMSMFLVLFRKRVLQAITNFKKEP